MTDLLIQPLEQNQDDDDLIHTICCNEDVALCGTVVRGCGWTNEASTCVVCRELEGEPCRDCRM